MIDFGQNLSDLIALQRNALTKISGYFPSGIVIMGCGELAETLSNRINGRSFDDKMQRSLSILAYCDNNQQRHGEKFCGKPIFSVEDAVKMFPEIAFVVAIYNASEPRKQLEALGCKRIVSVATLCRFIGPPLTSLLSIDYPRAIFEQKDKVLRCENLWADQKSRDIYNRLLEFHVSYDNRCVSEHDPLDEGYWPPGLWTENPDEVMVDCGAYDGDTVYALMRLSGGKFKKIVAFEPDRQNYDRLVAGISLMTNKFPWLIEPVNAAVGEKNGHIGFSSIGTISSSVTPGADNTVKCVALDDFDILDGEHQKTAPTYIKMDLEGHELPGLKGCRRLMLEHAPIMAITSYHRQEHLWKIALAMHDAQPDYKLFLRQYADDASETIVYAVPSGRLKR